MKSSRIIKTLALALSALLALSACGGNTPAASAAPTPSSTPIVWPDATASAAAPTVAPTEKPAEPIAANPPQAVPDSELFVLRAVNPSTFMEFTIADEMGFFRDAGIKIKYVGAKPTGITDYQMMEQGEIDVSYSGHPSGVAQARAAGLHVTMIVPGMVDSPDNPHVNYLVRNDSDIQSIDDILGKKVGMTGTGVCTDGYLQYYLDFNGLDSSKVEFVTLPGSGVQEQSLVQGLIDVTTSHTPYSSILLETGEVRSIGMSWDVFHSPGAGLGARAIHDSIIEDHPEVAQGFVDAMYRGRIWSNRNPVEAQNLMAAVLGLEEGSVLALIQDENKNIDPEYIKLWMDLGEKVGVLRPGEVKAEETYTNAFVPKDIPESDSSLHWDGLVHNDYGQ